MADFRTTHSTSAGLGNNATKNTELVMTPCGWRPRSHVHLIEAGYHASGKDGRLTKVHTRSGKVVADFGGISNTPQADSSKVASPEGGPVPLPDNYWVTYSTWQNNSGQPIGSFSTRWKVPPAPKTDNGQVLFLFNGLSDTYQTAILQPVLQWARTTNGGSGHWSIKNWYAPAQGYQGHLLVSDAIDVSPGDELLGIMTLIGVSGNAYGASYSYLSSFAGYAAINLQVLDVPELTLASEALEVYGVTHCSDYPDCDATAMSDIDIIVGSGNEATIDWESHNAFTDCGQHCVIVSNTSPKGRVDLYYRTALPFVPPKDAIIKDLVILWILRHGGEWPDWNSPFGQVLLATALGKLGSGLTDQTLRAQLGELIDAILAANPIDAATLTKD